ncbi:HNH endonuclease [hydrothermal vent metagenome]|uniref:HNH endonuclease n=1 Tax=hydrothermal vent metagenome TaxID=652676 RepID=A0A3B1D158_9ZZZZ
MEISYTNIDEEVIKKEKSKARLLRNSQWWKRRKSRGLCHYCEAQFLPAELTMDHIVPISRGGKSNKGNTVPACKTCNNQKKYLLPIEWEAYLDAQDKKALE